MKVFGLFAYLFGIYRCRWVISTPNL